jgi:hypothetical protein
MIPFLHDCFRIFRKNLKMRFRFNPNRYLQVRVNLPAVKRRAETLVTRRTVKQQWQV